MRLDHFIARNLAVSESTAKHLIAGKKVIIDGEVEADHLSEIGRFSQVECNGEVLQTAIPRLYIMLNKPEGYVSATVDQHHSTVIDLIDHPYRQTLHIAGRLDRSSTGLLLLSNDSQWSEALTRPESKIAKVYLVETVDPIPPEAVFQFDEGFYFAYEGITTRPAKLEILAPRTARVTISEGKYHQVKRMFHRLDGNRLVSLHRVQIGDFRLPDDLKAGEWRFIEQKVH